LTAVVVQNQAGAGASIRSSPASLKPPVSSTMSGKARHKAPSQASQASVCSPSAGVVMAIATPRNGASNPK
jgi:hypothetical protein